LTLLVVSSQDRLGKDEIAMLPRLSHGLVGLLLCGSASWAADIPDYPFVFVSGNADSDPPPDVAVCSLTIRDLDPDPGEAEATVDGRLKAVLASLTAQDVSGADIKSSSLNKQIVTNQFDEKGPVGIRGYDLTRSLEFKLRRLASLPAIEAGLVGAANVEQIMCQFDRTDRAAIEADLLTKALHAAQEQGDRLAEPLGRHLGAAVAVSRIPFDAIAAVFGRGERFSISEAGARMFKKSVAGDDLLVPATIHLSVTVNVLFKMD
jgi:uncharacterized protein YggE